MNSEAGQSFKNVIGDKSIITTILKGIFTAYMITIPMFITFAYILSMTNYPKKLMTPAVLIITAISIMVAGSSVTKCLRNKGWLNGGMVGFLYMLILYLISSLVFNNFSIDKNALTMIVVGVLAGMLGGVVGVNLKKSIKSKFKR